MTVVVEEGGMEEEEAAAGRLRSARLCDGDRLY